MKSGGLVFTIGLLLLILIDIVFWFQIKTYMQKKWQIAVYWFQALFFIVTLIIFQYLVRRIQGPNEYFWVEKLIGVLILVYSPKTIFILLNGTGLVFKKWSDRFASQMRKAGTLLSLILFLFLFYSITWGRYNYKLDRVSIPINHLPSNFQDFTIVQLSDLHLGSFGESYRGINRLVEEVNALQPDLIVFTGDMVNNFATEISPWIESLKGLQAKYGKYAVTGNHDYGDYTHWNNPQDKQNNLKHFFENMQAMGFHLLNNAHVPIVLHGDTLWLAGVENWGKPPFPQYGNLKVALDSIPKNRPIILLTHDPSHWKAEILQYPISLTLSGHTHAMQMGIQIGKRKWSPSRYLYPEYDGLYQNDTQYLYVNRGQGYLGFPGRIGLRPVITLLTLKTASP